MDIITKLKYCQQNYFAKFLLDQWKGEESTLCNGFQINDASENPNHITPFWFDKSMNKDDIGRYWIYIFFNTSERVVLELWLNNGFFVKGNEWFDDLWLKWSNQIATVFILSGNINDYAFNHMKGYMPTCDFVADEFLNRDNGSDCVISFSLSRPFYTTYKEGTSLDNKSSLESQIEAHLERRRAIPDLYNQLVVDFQFLDDILIKQQNLIIVLSNADLIFTNENSNIIQSLLSDYLLSWALSTQVAHNNNAVILISETAESINRHLVSQSSKLEIIHIPRPKTDIERLKFLLYVHSLSKQNESLNPNTRAKRVVLPTLSQGIKGVLSLTENLIGLSKQTSGLNFIGIEDLLLQIKASGDSSEKIVNRVKANILQTESGGILELITSKKDLDKDICGYLEIKKRLGAISEILRNNSVTKLQQRVIPMGILFVGPPGTGKTVVAQAFSNKCKMNFLKLGDFRSKWVGESERNLSKVLDLIKSYSPVIVFIDELDQTEGSRGTGGNNDVDKRVFSKLLQFMSDTENRGKVLWIAASNRPDLIDAALKRPGRFDLKIPFLPQNADERKETFLRYLVDKDSPELTFNIAEVDWQLVKEYTEGFTGAEIEEIVNSSIRKKIMEDNTNKVEILGNDILSAIKDFNPSIKSKDFNDMISASLADITSIDLIPKNWRDWKNPFHNQNEIK